MFEAKQHISEIHRSNPAGSQSYKYKEKRRKCVSKMLCITFIMIIGFLCYTTIQKYIYQNTYTETKDVIVSENHFPALTFCINRKQLHSYCGFDIMKQFPFSINLNKPCRPIIEESQSTKEIVLSNKYRKYWTNGIFEFSCVYSKDCSQTDIHLKYFETVTTVNGLCVVWNQNGKYHNKNNIIELTIGIRHRHFNEHLNLLEVFVHGPKTHGIEQYRESISFSTRKKHTVKLTKSKVSRKSCSDTPLSQFGSIYSRKINSVEECFDVTLCFHTLKNCGIAYDFCQDYIKEEYVKLNSSKEVHSITLGIAKSCLINQTQTVNIEKCKPKCHETKFDVIHSSEDSNDRNNELTIKLKYKNAFMYKEIFDREIYTLLELISQLSFYVILALTIPFAHFRAY